MMIILYEFALSPFVQKVKIALREKGLQFENRESLFAKDQSAFHAASPRREIPTLVDGEFAIWDSTIILDYLEERWPEPPLMPADPASRAEARMLEEICDTQLEAINFCLSEMMAFPDIDPEARDSVVAKGKADLLGLFGLLEEKLSNKDYFSGDFFGRADLSVLPHLNTANLMKNGPKSEALQAWSERANSRESVRTTLGEVRDALPGYKNMMARIHEGKEKRHYRDHRLDWLIRAGGSPILFDRIAKQTVRFPPSYA